MERKILYLDTEEDARNKLVKEFKRKEGGISVETAETPELARQKIEEKDFEVFITEHVSDKQLKELLEFAERKSPETITVIFTSDGFQSVPGNLVVSADGLMEKNDGNSYEKLVSQMEELLQDRSELSYPKPENEKERLRKLEEIDTEALSESERFDRLTEIGSEVFGTDFCFVGIVKEQEEMFFSFRGSDTETLERSCTICTFTINQDDVMEVENTQQDPRFKYINELQDLGITWYAGAPLITEDGHRIGAFCVADSDTRKISSEERRVLEILAEEAVEKIESEFMKQGALQKLKSCLGLK